MSVTGGSRNQEMSRARPEIRHIYVRRKKVVQQPNENRRHKENQPTSTDGLRNQELLRGTPEIKVIPFKQFYVRRRKKARVQQQIENELENENLHTRDCSMFDASMAPFLATLSNTQLLQFVVLMATANNCPRDTNEEAAAGTDPREV